jgi:hypothetical protein
MVEGERQAKMITGVKTGLFDVHPHPNPLPRGEGECFAVSQHIVSLRLFSAHPEKRSHPHAVPSPGGEGRGEGGRYTMIFRDSNTKFETPHVVSYR